MDMYPLVLLGLIALILLAVVAGAVYSVVSRKKAFNAIVAKNVAVTPLNYEDWQAKRMPQISARLRRLLSFRLLVYGHLINGKIHLAKTD